MDVKVWLDILPYICGGLSALFVLFLAKERADRIILTAGREFYGMLKDKRSRQDWYLKSERNLKKNGAVFHYGEWINPGNYLALKIIFGAAGYIILSGVNLAGGICAMLVLFFMPDILLNCLNKSDNERMLPEIKLIFNSLAIQIKAGMHVADALTECFAGVKNIRLRKAFLELSGDILMKSDIFEALENFQSKFDNRYIDSLCITVLQALESGQAIELLSDISEQVKDMEVDVLERRKGKLDRSITFYQLGILLSVLIVVLYACVSYMFDAALYF